MERLRLEQAADMEESKARLARQVLAQFDARQRLSVHEQLASAKRKIQQLETLVQVPPAKKPTLHLSKRDQLLSTFGFTSNKTPLSGSQPLLRCLVEGCDRLFETKHQRASHLKIHKPEEEARSDCVFVAVDNSSVVVPCLCQNSRRCQMSWRRCRMSRRRCRVSRRRCLSRRSYHMLQLLSLRSLQTPTNG